MTLKKIIDNKNGTALWSLLESGDVEPERSYHTENETGVRIIEKGVHVLVFEYAGHIEIITPDSPNWTKKNDHFINNMIKSNKMSDPKLFKL